MWRRRRWRRCCCGSGGRRVRPARSFRSVCARAAAAASCDRTAGPPSRSRPTAVVATAPITPSRPTACNPPVADRYRLRPRLRRWSRGRSAIAPLFFSHSVQKGRILYVRRLRLSLLAYLLTLLSR